MVQLQWHVHHEIFTDLTRNLIFAGQQRSAQGRYGQPAQAYGIASKADAYRGAARTYLETQKGWDSNHAAQWDANGSAPMSQNGQEPARRVPKRTLPPPLVIYHSDVQGAGAKAAYSVPQNQMPQELSSDQSLRGTALHQIGQLPSETGITYQPARYDPPSTAGAPPIIVQQSDAGITSWAPSAPAVPARSVVEQGRPAFSSELLSNSPLSSSWPKIMSSPSGSLQPSKSVLKSPVTLARGAGGDDPLQTPVGPQCSLCA